MVKFPVQPKATMFVSTAYDPGSAQFIGTPAPSLDDCVIHCHEDPLCEAVLLASQPDTFGNNCFLFQKQRANLSVF